MRKRYGINTFTRELVNAKILEVLEDGIRDYNDV